MRRFVTYISVWLLASLPSPAQDEIGKNEVRPWLGVKTNLLYDAALAPNVSVDVPLCRRVSVQAEYAQPWWSDPSRNQWCYQAMYGGAGVRMWFPGEKFGDAMPLRGAFVGLYGATGRFDVGTNGHGRQCDGFYTCGISAGMVHRFSAHWALELEVGMGYAHGDVHKYQVSADGQHLYFQEKKQFRWAGPARLGLSVVYLLHFGKKGGEL